LLGTKITNNSAVAGSAGSGGDAGNGYGGGVSIAVPATVTADRNTRILRNFAATDGNDIWDAGGGFSNI
jgi:hypothetical protein